MIAEAIAAIRRGEIVGLPTDTIYGVGVDPRHLDAVESLFELKGRPDHKPIGLLVADIQQARMIAEIEGVAADLADRHWPGPLTLVVRPKVVLADWVGDHQARTVGVRVPDHPAALGLLTAAGPLSVTSANRSGGPETMSDVEAREVFGDDVAVYVPGSCPAGRASTVVDVTGPSPVVLREGPIVI